MAARKKKQKPETVEGVNLSKLDKAVFNEDYGKLLEYVAENEVKTEVQLPGKRTAIEQRVKMMVLWYRAVTPDDELSGCDNCGGDSDFRLSRCPYCGDCELVDDDGNLIEESTPNTKTDPAPPPIEEEDEVEEPEVIDTTGEAPPEATDADDSADEPPPPPPKPKKPKGSGKANKAPRKRKLKKNGDKKAAKAHQELDEQAQGAIDRDQAGEDSSAGHIDVTSSSEGVAEVAKQFSTKDLDEAVSRCDEYKRDAANAAWRLGREIKRIVENRLWMLRAGDDGVAYRTFKQFVSAELGMSYFNAHRIMQVAEAYTEKQMKEIGVTKCHLMLKLPEDKRKEMLEQTQRDGASAAQVSKQVNELTGKERPKPPPKSGKPLTVAMAQGRVELQLHARPKGREGFPSAEEQKANPNPARSVSEDPFVTEILPNDVRVTYHVIQDTDGTLKLVIERKRAKEDELFPDEDSE